ncbi:hypothetical protein CK203_025303 [Vitis vinifera]|uniref:RNase H type-1 domain-containing protein n=1 Tax=Vitis vinifera TaxID=29760 RepID=A0A438IZU9_VITVI|nr:hypothetical protein CK203_025303 [Vitis vinifera]
MLDRGPRERSEASCVDFSTSADSLPDRQTSKSIRGSIIADHLASLPVSDGRVIDDDFPMRMLLLLKTTLELGIRQMEVLGDSNLVLKQIQGEWKTRDMKFRSYHAYLELLVGRFDDLRYTHLPRVQNQFANALATLASILIFMLIHCSPFTDRVEISSCLLLLD